jgi:sec-independent protein translocase protein TatA
MNLFIISGFIGPQEIVVILLVVLLLFGGKKIPELMKGMGKGMREFKNATAGKYDDDEELKEKPSLK